MCVATQNRKKIRKTPILGGSRSFKVDHEVLKRLQVTFGADDVALTWFSSYLADRKQHVRCGGSSSRITDVICGVPQGSVLGPILFIIITRIVADHGLSLPLYADDSQIYGACPPTAISSLSADIFPAVDDISTWMRCNRPR